MLWQIGPVTLSTFPLSTTGVEREDVADFAVHDLLGRRKGREHVGEGDDSITMRGSILPFAPMLDGRRELEMLRGAMKSGEPQLVMRGDGTNMGWYVVESISETATEIQYNGVGFRIDVEWKLTKVSDAQATANNGTDTGQSLFGALISLFG
jgi:phage protein U